MNSFFTTTKCCTCHGTGEVETGIGMFPCDDCDGKGEQNIPLQAKLNKRERKARQLLQHYARCEALGRYLGMTNPDGKRISVALWKAEKAGQKRAIRMCNDPEYTQNRMRADSDSIEADVRRTFHALPPGFFINSDPRGAALKIDNENPEGAKLIQACQLHTDMGGYGCLSPEIDGN